MKKRNGVIKLENTYIISLINTRPSTWVGSHLIQRLLYEKHND